MNILDVLGRITQLRESRGWTQYRLSKEAGVSQNTIKNLYHRNNTPTIQTLEAICKAFNITLTEFFADIDDPITTLTDKQRALVEETKNFNEKQQKVLDAVIALLKSTE